MRLCGAATFSMSLLAWGRERCDAMKRGCGASEHGNPQSDCAAMRVDEIRGVVSNLNVSNRVQLSDRHEAAVAACDLRSPKRPRVSA